MSRSILWVLLGNSSVVLWQVPCEAGRVALHLAPLSGGGILPASSVDPDFSPGNSCLVPASVCLQFSHNG